MYIFFTNGSMIQFVSAKSYGYAVPSIPKEAQLVVFGPRKKELGRFQLSTIQGWCYDNEAIHQWIQGKQVDLAL